MTAGILAIGILIAGSFAQASQPGIRSIATGAAHSFAVKNDGTLWAWGWNLYGQLGVDSSIAHLSPSQVGAATDWAAVTAGGNHTRALQSDGTLWAWGRNHYGQLGVGTDLNKYSPVPVLLPPADSPPVAYAGVDFSVNEAQVVTLDGSLSSDPNDDPLTYAWTQVGISAVVLVKVPHYMKKPAIESGGLIDSTN